MPSVCVPGGPASGVLPDVPEDAPEEAPDDAPEEEAPELEELAPSVGSSPLEQLAAMRSPTQPVTVSPSRRPIVGDLRLEQRIERSEGREAA